MADLPENKEKVLLENQFNELMQKAREIHPIIFFTCFPHFFKIGSITLNFTGLLFEFGCCNAENMKKSFWRIKGNNPKINSVGPKNPAMVTISLFKNV